MSPEQAEEIVRGLSFLVDHKPDRRRVYEAADLLLFRLQRTDGVLSHFIQHVSDSDCPQEDKSRLLGMVRELRKEYYDDSNPSD